MKPNILKGLSLTINEKEVIVVGDIVLSFYKAENGSRRIKINAPTKQTIQRVSMEKYLQFIEQEGLTYEDK